MIEIRLNGVLEKVAESTNLAELVTQFQLNPGHVAVAKNLEVIPRGELAATRLSQGDEVEIFHAVGGG